LEGCTSSPPWPLDRIWDIDPVTGQSHVFVNIPHPLCSSIYGLAFTPDGSRLLACLRPYGAVVEIDGNANIAIRYSQANGVTGPVEIAYNAAGDFFVLQHPARNILRFPASGGPATVFADAHSGVFVAESIAPAPDGGLYFGSGYD